MFTHRNHLVLSLMLLSGCVGATYLPPTIAVPDGYGSAPAAVATQDLAQWWTAFNDPTLDDLIARARLGNWDMRQAAARVAQARAQQRLTQAEGGPSLNASAQGGYTKLSENSLPAALSNLGNLNGSSTSGSGLGVLGEGFTTYQTGFDASWELDIFGGRRRANEAAAARTEAAMWSQRDAEILLVAEVANNYHQHRALRRRIEIADQMLAARRETLEFIAVRSRHGFSDTLEQRRQEQAISQLAAQRETLIAQADVRMHALSILLGLSPDALSRELAESSSAAQWVIDIPVGLPSDLLRRRPDIRAAERRLAAATADIGVARADLYPKISLTGALQLASRSLSTLLEKDSLMGSAAGRISLPLIGRGARRARVELRETQADEVMLAYQAEVFAALQDVEDALTRLQAERQRLRYLGEAQRAAQDVADTTAVQYRNGLIGYIEVLEASQNWFAANDALMQAEATTAQETVALYKALGGGWDERRVATTEGDSSGR